ncbi:class I SAM-dependent methyltransferase [Herbaspirillum sp. ST 5-3]|uniref:class I SAM-dependent methyltransferase n=1 Tax=Oxalobacteraceae TaxID=75682 RepID=UPI0010A50E0C|nr:class I SAM-dependent methyltransferase [Herbaspirillum sp. ST 5-3]
MTHTCRFCGAGLRDSFCDLGMSPLSNSYVAEDGLQKMEPFFPLHAYVCASCFLVQLPEFESPQHIFSDYAYFSSYSDSWLAHARKYTETVIARFGFNTKHQVIEIASNDGYLLQYFKEKGVPVLGIEPAANVAEVARKKGIPSRVEFFGRQSAHGLVQEGLQADLLLGNNVLAHVPDINDFVAGMKVALKSDGVITMEFPHLLQLMQQNQFDTIYHEHFSYLSFTTVEKIFAAHGLTLFDVEELGTHGGSLRIYGRHTADESKAVMPAIDDLRRREAECGLTDMAAYAAFSEQVCETKRALLAFCIDAKRAGKRIVGYGAPAKGNTLLNYCGIRQDFLDYTVDRSPHKQGRYLPGTHIPIHSPDKISETRPDYVLILPWNLKEEVLAQMAHVRSWGGRFVVPIPRVEVIE